MTFLFFSFRIALSMIKDAEDKGLITPGKVSLVKVTYIEVLRVASSL